MSIKVSLVTAVLNRRETIEDTLQSILCQDYPDIECVVVDGGSTDGTIGIIEKYCKLFSRPLKYIQYIVYQ